MKIKLVNKQTKEEHICSKIVIDGFDYYVSDDEQPKIEGELYHCFHKGKGINVGLGVTKQRLIIDIYSKNRNLCPDCKKVIATNNPSIDLPKVVHEHTIVIQNSESLKNLAEGEYQVRKAYFLKGYNKSQETHPFSEEDMIEFSWWLVKNLGMFSCDRTAHFNKELLQIWKEQRIKIIYYN